MIQQSLRASVLAGAITALFSSQAMAQAAAPEPDYTLSGNVGLFSEYIFRGIGQTNQKPAVQGGFDFAHKSGFYLGTWASNVSWVSDAAPDVSNSVEWDFYGGFKFPIVADFSGDVGILYYWYPGTYPSGFTKPDTTELYAALTWKWITAKYSYSIDDTFGFSDSDGSYYLEGNAAYDIVDKVNDYIGKVTIDAHVGYQSYKNYGDYSYTDWKVGVSTDISGFIAGLYVSGTDADSAVYTNRFGKDLAETRVVGYVKKSF